MPSSTRVHTAMAPRDPEEAHRAATPLELFFDLTFVVAIAQAAAAMHHEVIEGHGGDGVLAFVLSFFAIWWAWMNFTWFASAYDTDDALYRLMVFLQMTGVLILAAGIPRAFDDQDFGVVTTGYVVMRLAMVGQWLRAARSHPDGRSCALRYALGITAVQILWVARLALPAGPAVAGFVVLALLELAVPYWAEATGRTAWHPGHIAERYGLFTIIVLGESVLAATIGVQVALDAGTSIGDLAAVIVGGLLVVFAMWWIYFDMPAERMVHGARDEFVDHRSRAFVWGYGHYFVFASVAAAGAGLAINVDHAIDHSELSDVQAGFCVAGPVAIFLLAVWVLHRPYKAPGYLRDYAAPVGAAVILATTFTSEPVLLTGLLLGVLCGLMLVFREGQEATA